MTSWEYYNDCDETEKDFIAQQVRDYYFHINGNYEKEIKEYSVEELQEMLDRGKSAGCY